MYWGNWSRWHMVGNMAQNNPVCEGAGKIITQRHLTQISLPSRINFYNYLPLIGFLFGVWDDGCVSLVLQPCPPRAWLWSSCWCLPGSLAGGWIDSTQTYFGLWGLKLGWQSGWMLFFDLLERNRVGGVLGMLYYGHWLEVVVVVMFQAEHPLEGHFEAHFDQLYQCMT